jgi:heme-degrading monooxygenase HmoA
MIARVWEGVVPLEKADGYGAYLADSDRGVSDYRRITGNRGVLLLRRVEGDRVRFLLVSLWDTRKAIAAYAGADIDRAQYFDYDRECLVDPSPQVRHYEVMVAEADGGVTRGPGDQMPG